MKDYYALLGVEPSADEVAISTAWKALDERHHADCFRGLSKEENERFYDVMEAYNILSNLAHRKAYDELWAVNKESEFPLPRRWK